MGNDQNSLAINLLKENDIKDCFAILLTYYDRYYLKSSFQYERKSLEIDPKTYVPEDIAEHLISLKDSLHE
jgi:hypothetical protein